MDLQSFGRCMHVRYVTVSLTMHVVVYVVVVVTPLSGQPGFDLS